MLNPAVKRRHLLFTGGLLAGLALVCATTPARALSERVMHDAYTGIAIGGFDPVAYFLDGEPVAGNPLVEVAWGGAYWLFANPGNAAAFEDAPEVYAPAYGGYGVVGISRGVPQPGDPRLFAIWSGRLFFFFDEADVAAFHADPEGLIATADARWPEVAETLAH